jgi:hypothetical protein
VWSSGPEGFIFGCENGTLVSVFLEQVLFFFLSGDSWNRVANSLP